MTLELGEPPVGEGSLELMLDLAGGQRLVFATYVRGGSVRGQNALCLVASDRDSCSYGDEFPITGNPSDAALGDTVHARGTLEDGAVAFSLDDAVRIAAPAESGPIVRWEFFMTACAGSAFEIRVDDLEVTLADGGK